jgi:hypothetical protein
VIAALLDDVDDLFDGFLRVGKLAAGGVGRQTTLAV